MLTVIVFMFLSFRLVVENNAQHGKLPAQRSVIRSPPPICWCENRVARVRVFLVMQTLERWRKLQWGLLIVCADSSIIVSGVYWAFLYNGWTDQLNLQVTRLDLDSCA